MAGKGKVDLRLGPAPGATRQWKLVQYVDGKFHAEALFTGTKGTTTTAGKSAKVEGREQLYLAIGQALDAGFTVHALSIDQTGAGSQATYLPDGAMRDVKHVTVKDGYLGPRCFELPWTAPERKKRQAKLRGADARKAAKAPKVKRPKKSPPKQAVKAKAKSKPKVTKKPKTTKAAKPKVVAKSLPKVVKTYLGATSNGMSARKIGEWAARHARMKGPIASWIKRTGSKGQKEAWASAAGKPAAATKAKAKSAAKAKSKSAAKTVAKSKAAPVKSKTKPPKSKTKPPKSKTKPPKSKTKPPAPAKSKTRPPKSKTKPPKSAPKSAPKAAVDPELAAFQAMMGQMTTAIQGA